MLIDSEMCSSTHSYSISSYKVLNLVYKVDSVTVYRTIEMASYPKNNLNLGEVGYVRIWRVLASKCCM